MFWLGVIVSLCFVPGVTGAFIATQWPVLAIVLPFSLFRSGPFTLFHGLGLAFVAYAVMTMLWTPTPYASVFGLWLVIIMALALWFGTTLTDVRKLYAGLAIGAGVSSALAVAQYFGHDTIGTNSIHPPGLYVNSVQQGTVLALIAVALVTERMWLWVLPLVPGIVLSGSRGGWLVLAVGLLACRLRRVWLLAAVLVAGVLYLTLLPLSASDTERLLIWQAAWDSLTWSGWGPGVFYTILLPQNGTLFYPEHAHNDALQLVFEYGAAAILPIGVVAFALSRTAAREWPVVLAFVVAGCFSFPLWMPVASFLALVSVGRILRCDDVACSVRNNRRQHVVPWRRWRTGKGRQFIPVASHHSNEG